MPESKPQIELLVVFFGGMIGGAARYLLSLVPLVGTWPAMTVLINTVGTGLLACLAAYMKEKQEKPAYLQSFLGTGILGGFTTFGALMVESQQMIKNSHYLFLVLLLVASLALAFLALHFGEKFGRKLSYPQAKGADHVA